MSKAERKQQIKDLNEAIFTYECLLDDAISRNNTSEIAQLRRDIQKCKREKVALKDNKEFKLHPEEELYFAMMGA